MTRRYQRTTTRTMIRLALLLFGLGFHSNTPQQCTHLAQAETISITTKKSSSSGNSNNKIPAAATGQDDEAKRPPSRGPFELTSQNFDLSVSDGNVWLVEFYTPWCRHCQNFAPSYNSIATVFHSAPQEKIRVGKVDCNDQRALCSRFDIMAYPSFYIVDGWSVYKFEDNRSEANLMVFARGGYKKQEKLPIWQSPMGPMGLLQGGLVFMGTTVVDLFQSFNERFGVSPILTGFILCFVGVGVGLFSILVFVLITAPRVKND